MDDKWDGPGTPSRIAGESGYQLGDVVDWGYYFAVRCANPHTWISVWKYERKSSKSTWENDGWSDESGQRWQPLRGNIVTAPDRLVAWLEDARMFAKLAREVERLDLRTPPVPSKERN